jgi:hypothetical protein
MIVLPANGIHEDIDAAEAPGGIADDVSHLPLIEGIGAIRVGLATRGRDLGDSRVQPLAVVIDRGDAAALTADDIGGRTADSACRRRDECHLAREAHDPAPPLHCFPTLGAILHQPSARR